MKVDDLNQKDSKLNLPEQCCHVLLRHATPSKRGEYWRISTKVVPAFENTSSSGSPDCISGKMHSAERWTAIIDIEDEPWFPVFSSKPADHLYKENAKSPKLEVVLLKIEDGQLIFNATKDCKVTIELEGEGDEEPTKLTCTPKRLMSALQKCETSLQMFQKLCEHYKIVLPLYNLRLTEGKFELIGKEGEPVKDIAREHMVFTGYGIEPGTNEAAELMNYAVETCNPKLIHEALDDGAPVDRLPKTALTPLVKVLKRGRSRPDWKQCAEILIEAGSSVDQVSRSGEPLIVVTCDHLCEDDYAPKVVKFLAEQGANINQPDASGNTAIVSAAIHKKLETVSALMDAGADPNSIFPTENRSIIEEIKHRRDKDLKRNETSEFDKVLELLTGNINE